MGEVLLYGEIYSYSSAEFIKQIDEVEGDELVVRVNCLGGVPEYGWGMAAKFNEFKGRKLVKVDGQAHSMALMFLCYAEDVEAVDPSEFLLHRAAYPEYFERSAEWFTDEVKGNLVRVNKSLKAALEGKIDIEKFNELKQVKEKGITFDDIFSMDSRIDIFLSAKDAKKVGLINRIVELTPKKKSEIQQLQKAALYVPKESQEPIIKTLKKMDIEKFKSEYPDIYKQAVAIGEAQERERVEAFMVFADIDIKAVKEGIEGGKNLSPKQMSEFTLKAVSKTKLKDVKDDAATETETEEPVVTVQSAKEKAVQSFEEKVRKELGLKN